MENEPKLIKHAFVEISEIPRIYIDPYEVPGSLLYADYIFITHPHYDHLSVKDIEKLLKNSTKIIAPEDARSLLSNFKNVTFVEPEKKYIIDNLEIYTMPAYNINKNFHPKNKKWVGYIIKYKNKTFYHPGDTDFIPEMKTLNKLNIDYAFFPVGGTYTMDYKEAAEAANIIKAKISIPMHYGLIVGKKTDAEEFKQLVKNSIVKILL